MVCVTAACVEPDSPGVKSPGLALHAREAASIIDDEVTPRVLAEWKVDAKAAAFEYEHDRKRRAIADHPWVLSHLESISAWSDVLSSEPTTEPSPTMT
jgi:hypothetical protein